jgi:hypothetical protein
LKRVWSVDVTRCPRCGGNVRILCAIINLRSVKRLLEHLGIARPRAPNPHDCPPPPGTQLLLPVGPTVPIAPLKAPVPPSLPEDEQDPRLDGDWPVDAPFEDH